MGVAENVSSTMGYDVMNDGLPSEMTPSTADNVTMITHSRGRKSPSADPMMSAITLTVMVMVPSTCMGIMNKMMPTTEGTMNPASWRALYCFMGVSDFRSLR